MPNIFVTAASGNIGTKLVPLLVQSPSANKIVLPTGNSAKLAENSPKSDLINIVEGSIQDPSWVESQLVEHQIDTVFLCIAGSDELLTTVNFISAMKRAGCVKQLIYISACGDMGDRKKTELWLTSYALTKTMIEQVIRDGLPELAWTILGPSMFFSNDTRSYGMLRDKGMFSYPLGKIGMSRVDTEDIALATLKVIEDQGKKWNRQKIMIGTKEAWTDHDTQQVWSKALGKPVSMWKADKESMDTFEGQMGSFAGPALARGLRLMYDALVEQGFPLTDEEYRQQVELLGREAHGYKEFVEKTGAELKAKWEAEKA